MALADESIQGMPVKNKQKLSLDLRLIVAVLLLVIGAMLIIWKPWAINAANVRTIEVRGEATLTAQPDEFIFHPSYKFENADKNAALAELTRKSDELVAKLKELGVSENKIKTNSNGSSGAYDPMMPKEKISGTNYILQLTVTVSDTKIAQKVQDYLVTTAPLTSVSPQATFSDIKRKELEDKARVEALKDSKTKADQMAKELGVRVDKVKTVNDGSFTVFPSSESRSMGVSDGSMKSSSGIHAGENELPYSVTVIYFIY